MEPTENHSNNQFTNTTKHTIRNTNMSIDRSIHTLQSHNIPLTTTKVQEIIKHCKNVQGPNKLNIRHPNTSYVLDSPTSLTCTTSHLNSKIIPRTWKLTHIILIPKPNKDINMGTSYKAISLLSVISRTLEKSLLPNITNNI